MNILEMIKENWLLLVIAAVGLVGLNAKDLFNLFKNKVIQKTEDNIIESKVSVLPHIFSHTESLVDMLEKNGFQKSSIEAKNLIKKIINEYSEI